MKRRTFGEFTISLNSNRSQLSFSGSVSGSDTFGFDLTELFETDGEFRRSRFGDLSLMTVDIRCRCRTRIVGPLCLFSSNRGSYNVAVVGSLPAGVRRAISFDEDAIEVGSGTITIRATTAPAPTLDYRLHSWLPPWHFADNTGDAQSSVGVAIASITIPRLLAARTRPTATQGRTLPSRPPGRTAQLPGPDRGRLARSLSQELGRSDTWTVAYAFVDPARRCHTLTMIQATQ